MQNFHNVCDCYDYLYSDCCCCIFCFVFSYLSSRKNKSEFFCFCSSLYSCSVFLYSVYYTSKELSKRYNSDYDLEKLGFYKIESESNRTKAVYANYFCKFTITKKQATLELLEINPENNEMIKLVELICEVMDGLEDEE